MVPASRDGRRGFSTPRPICRRRCHETLPGSRLGALAILALAETAQAAWDNVFQVSCFRQPARGGRPVRPGGLLPGPGVAAVTVAAARPGPAPARSPSAPPSTSSGATTSPSRPTSSRPCWSRSPPTRPATIWSRFAVTGTRCYFDPCTCSYQQVATPVTSYRVRSRCNAVTSYLQRCQMVPVQSYRLSYYMEPVTTCCTPPPTPCCNGTPAVAVRAARWGRCPRRSRPCRRRPGSTGPRRVGPAAAAGPVAAAADWRAAGPVAAAADRRAAGAGNGVGRGFETRRRPCRGRGGPPTASPGRAARPRPPRRPPPRVRFDRIARVARAQPGGAGRPRRDPGPPAGRPAAVRHAPTPTAASSTRPPTAGAASEPRPRLRALAGLRAEPRGPAGLPAKITVDERQTAQVTLVSR